MAVSPLEQKPVTGSGGPVVVTEGGAQAPRTLNLKSFTGVTRTEPRNINAIETDMKKLVDEVEQVYEQKLSKKATDTLAAINARIDKMTHAAKAEAFLNFKESEKYVEGLKNDVEASGTKAISTFDQSSSSLKKISQDKYLTFANIKTGSVHEISGTPYLAKHVDASPAGTIVEFLPMSQKFLIAGEPVTPYSGVVCSFDGKELTLDNFHRLKPDDVLVISGKSYIPKMSILGQKHYQRFELELIND